MHNEGGLTASLRSGAKMMIMNAGAMLSTTTNMPDLVESSSAPYVNVIGAKITRLSKEDCAQRVIDLAKQKSKKYVCVASAHTIMEGFDHPRMLEILNRADMTVADGVSIIIALKILGDRHQHRTTGTDLVWETCRLAAENGLSVGFYGSSDECLNQLRAMLATSLPYLNVAYTYSPPFRELSVEEDEALMTQMNESNTDIMFIGLGNPKQEWWIDAHYQRSQAVLLGVGAAFDFISGMKKRAPKVVRKLGLEWLWRLVKEPKRMWRRNFVHNPRYLWQLFLQLTRLKKFEV